MTTTGVAASATTRSAPHTLVEHVAEHVQELRTARLAALHRQRRSWLDAIEVGASDIIQAKERLAAVEELIVIIETARDGH
jgi:hypothetical protein